MRKFLPAVVLLLISFNCIAQLDIGLGYALGVPLQSLAKHTQPAHQAVLTANYRLPIKAHPQFWVGIDLGIGNYANKTIEQTFKFSDGSTTRTDVRYNSNIAYAHGAFRYDIPVNGKVIPYVKITGGVTEYFTNLYVEDPSDPDGCKALDQDIALNDFTMTYSYGGGFLFNITRQKNRRATYLLDVSVSNVRGGDVDYLNVKHLGEHNHDTQQGDVEAKPFTTKFINVNSQAIHEHQLAEVYNSEIRMLQVKAGLVIKFNYNVSKSVKKSGGCRSRCLKIF